MTYAVYTDREGYIGDVSAPTREAAAAFLAAQGYDLAAVELRELVQWEEVKTWKTSQRN